VTAVQEYCTALIDWVYNEGAETSLREYRGKLDGLDKLVNPSLQRKWLQEEITRTYETMESKVNLVLIRADTPEVAHIPAEEREKVKDEALLELKRVKEVEKLSKAHDWTLDFNCDIKKIQDT